jgi:predicted Zn-dependent protease
MGQKGEFMKVWFLLLSILVFTGIVGAIGVEKAELEAEAKRVLMLGDIDKRKEVDVLYALGDVYLDEGDVANAKRLLGEALRVDSLNFTGQVKYAELLLKDDQKTEAIEKLKTVYTYAEEAELIDRSASILIEQGISLPSYLPKDPNDLKGPILYIVAVGNKNKVLMQEMAAELGKIIKMNVEVLDTAVLEVGPFDRNHAKEYIEHIAENIKEWLEPQDFRRRLRLCGISSIESASYDMLKVFVWSTLKESLKDEEFSKFVETLDEYEKSGQYDSNRLYRLLVDRYPLSKPTMCFLGITGYDIYAPDTNFVFGSSGLGHAIMSYHRFSGKFSNTTQNRPRLVKRTVKQAVSSAFFMLSIQRCNSPMCMRAYSNTLEEHDAKQDTLCSWCQRQLDEKLAVMQSQRATKQSQRSTEEIRK